MLLIMCIYPVVCVCADIVYIPDSLRVADIVYIPGSLRVC